MKPHLDYAHEGTLGDEDRVRMRFDPASTAHLMKVLIDLYSNPAAAVVREYSTNAWDSHIEAGVTDPIEITLPTILNPIFIVKDHGVGLSEEQILNNFSLYGWSSKRDSDDAVGMLGLGCKSALTYTPSFTMIVTKDHYRATILVTREADGTGAVQVVERSRTFEGNGVEVRVPVSAVSSFVAEVHKFFRFWPAGTVLIDGELNKDYFDREHGDFPLDPDVTLTTRVESNYVIMGNVGYPLAYGQPPLVQSKKGNLKAVIRVPIGEIDFAPNREALSYTDRTLDVLNDARIFIQAGVKRKAQAEIDRCATHSDALRKAVEWRAYWGDYSYRSLPIPISFHTNRTCTLRWACRHRNNASKRTAAITVDDALKAIHVVGHHGRSLDEATKWRIQSYIETNKLEVDLTFAYPKPVGDPWLDGVPVVDYETIKAIPLPDHMRRERATKVKYRRLTSLGLTGTNEIPGDRPVCYVLYAKVRDEWIASSVGAWFEDNAVTLVRVTEKGLLKFIKQHPDAIAAERFVQKMIELKARNMTENERVKIQHGDQFDTLGFRRFTKEDLPRILDPGLRRLIQDINGVGKVSTQWWDSLTKVAQYLAVEVPEVPKSQDLVNRVRAVYEQYPLLRAFPVVKKHYFVDPFNDRSIGGIDKEAFIDYANALYWPTILLPY